MSLPEKLAAFRTRFEAGAAPYHAPSWVHEPMRRATAELVASGAAERTLKAGDHAPYFSLNDVDGSAVSSRELLTNGPLVLSFYMGVWCPYCNMELQALQEMLPACMEHRAQLVAISPQTRSNSRKSRRQSKLTFPVLSDPGNEVAAKFGLRFELPEYLIRVYRDTFKNDLAQINGEPSWTLPMPSRYVIGTDGVIAYAEVNPDYTRRPDPSELLPILLRLQNRVPSNGDQSVPWK